MSSQVLLAGDLPAAETYRWRPCWRIDAGHGQLERDLPRGTDVASSVTEALFPQCPMSMTLMVEPDCPPRRARSVPRGVVGVTTTTDVKVTKSKSEPDVARAEQTRNAGRGTGE